MDIKCSTIVGTLESSDVQITISPHAEKLELNIESDVIHQYGKKIKAVVLDTLKRLDVTKASVTVIDKGALDCTIIARIEVAVYRACGGASAYKWGQENE